MTLRSVDFESTASASSARRPFAAYSSSPPPRRRQIGDEPCRELGAQADALAQRRMRMDGVAHVLDVGAHLDGEADLRDQLAGVLPHDAAADDAQVGFVVEELGETLLAAVGERAAARRPGEDGLAILARGALE